jgi:hypothetical protein
MNRSSHEQDTAGRLPALGRRWSRWVFASTLIASLATLLPTPSFGQQPLDDLSAQIPVTPDCSGCLSSTTGSVTIQYNWYASYKTSQATGSAPSDARVVKVYLDGLPTGGGVALYRLDMTHGGWTDFLFQTYANGTVYRATQSAPKTFPWAGQLVHGTDWVASPFYALTGSSPELHVKFVIEWEVPSTPPPPPPAAVPVGQFEYMGPRAELRSYAYDPNNQSRTVEGYIGWTPAFSNGSSRGPDVSFALSRPSLNASLGIQGDHAYDSGATSVSDLFADGVTRAFRLYAKSSDGKETVLPGSPKMRCYLPNADRTSITPCDGTLLRRPDGRLYVIAGGAAFLFANDTEAQSLGYTLANIELDTEGFYALASSWRLRDGTLVRFGPSNARYVAVGGGLFWASSPARWSSYLNTVGKSEAQLLRLPASYMPKSVPAPTVGTAVQEVGKNALWVYQGGGRFWVPSPASWTAYGQATGITTARFVPEGSLSDVAVDVNGVDQSWPRNDLTPRDGTAVYELSKGNIWVYQGGGRFWAHDPASWSAYGQATGITNALPLPAGSLSSVLVEVNGVAQVQAREDLTPRDGTAVYEVGNVGLWVYQGGGRFWAPSPASWSAYGQATGITTTHPIPFASLSVVITDDAQGNAQIQSREDTRPRDGTLVRQANNTGVFVYQGGGNFLFPSANEFDLWPGPRSVLLVPDGSLSGQLVGDANYQETYQVRDDLPADGTLLRERTGTQVYQVTGQKKVPATSYDPAQVKLVPDTSLQRVPNG